jgi:hypothetical protein
MKTVWLLWEGDGETQWLEGVFIDKVLAEMHLRMLHAQNEAGGRVYHLWIQEKGITK